MHRRSPLVLAALVAACSAKNPGAATTTPSPGSAQVSTGATAASRRDPRVITQAELDATPGVSTAWEAIMRLRPNFLRDADQRRMGTTDSRPTVRVDNADFGTTESLKSLSVSGVGEIRFLDASEATARFGTRTGMAVIWITSRRAGR